MNVNSQSTWPVVENLEEAYRNIHVRVQPRTPVRAPRVCIEVSVVQGASHVSSGVLLTTDEAVHLRAALDEAIAATLKGMSA